MRFPFIKRLNQSLSNIRTRLRRIRFTDIELDSNTRPATLRKLRLESIKLYNGDSSLARALIDILCNNVVGSGLEPSLNLNGIDEIQKPDELEKQIKTRWEIWSKNTRSDYSGITDFLDLQRQAYLSQLLQGEVFSIQRNFNNAFTVQLIEGHRVTFSGTVDGLLSPEGDQGIKYNRQGAEIEITFDDQFRIPVKTADGRKQIIHLFKQLRPGQMRGVPHLTATIRDFTDLQQYSDTEMKSAIVASSFTAFIKSPNRDALGEGPFRPEGEETDSEYDSTVDYAMKPGAIYSLDPGEDVTTVNPTRPNSGFQAFYDTKIRDLAASTGIPFNILVKKFDTSYTAARAATLEFWKTIMEERNLFARRFCQEIFNQWLFLEVVRGDIIIPGYLESVNLQDEINNSVVWIGSAQPQIDETKAANAARIRIETGLSNHELETKQMGKGNFSDNAAKLKSAHDELSFQREQEIVSTNGTGVLNNN